MRRPSSLSIRLSLIVASLLISTARPQGSPIPAPHRAPEPNQTHSTDTPTERSQLKKAEEAYRRGLRAEKEGDWSAARDAYSDAVDWAPNQREYLRRREIARTHLVQAQLDLAERDTLSGRLQDAHRELIAASDLDPTNAVVRTRLAELNVLEPDSTPKIPPPIHLASGVHLDYQPGTKSLDLRGDTQSAYEELAHQFGVEVAFDVDLGRRPIRFEVSGVDFPTAAHLLGTVTRTFWRPLTSHLFFVTEDTPQKRKDYDASIVQTILLPASESPEQMTEMLRAVREIAGITRSGLDIGSRTLTLRASPRAIALAADLLDNLEQPSGELILEIEILEIDRNFARQLGITPPQGAKVFTISTQQLQEAEQSYEGLLDVLNQVFGTSSIPPLLAFGGGASTFLAKLPNVAANFSEALSLVRGGRKLLLRARDGQAATFFVGDRIPVSLSSYSPSLSPGSGNGSSSLPAITNYAAGGSPAFVATDTLRNDSINDLVVANSGANTISVLLGNGDGTFENQVSYATGNDPVWIASGQFNSSSDDFPDLAVADKGSDTVSILLGNGDGTFQKQTTLRTGHSPMSVIAANFHDLTASAGDLAVANQGDNTISIFQGNGDGTFQAPRLIPLPAGFEPSALAAADLNDDGHLDLVIADTGNDTISVMLGNGDGTFQPRTDYSTGNNPVYVAFGDFNQDGAPDIAVANNRGNTVTIYYNQQNDSGVPLGKFVAGSVRDVPAGNGPSSIAVADYNLDGSPDLAVSDATDNAVTVLLNAGKQSFTSLSELPVGNAPVSIASADFNGDGRPDVATADNGAAEATVILNSTSLFGSGTGSTGSPFPGVQYLDIGLKVKATPRFHPGNTITLQLNFEISSLTGQSFNNIPVISNESVDQTMLLEENETGLVAEFLQSQLTNAIAGNPGVASVPGIGPLDQNRNSQDQNSELLILVTPRQLRFAPRKNHIVYAGQEPLEDTAGIPATGVEQPPVQPPSAPASPTSPAEPPQQTPSAPNQQTPSPTGPRDQSGIQPPIEQRSPQP
jgi:type II/III secretion system protein/VCBS repeat protein